MTRQALHLRLIGPTGSGKSVIAQAVASEMQGKLIIIDPVWKPANWGGLPAVTVDSQGGYGPIGIALDQIINEMKTRGAKLQQGVEQFERLTILFDEVPDTVTELPEQAGLLIRRLAQRGRHGNMHLIGMGQSERVKSWGLDRYGDAAENFATIYLGVKALDRIDWLSDVTQYPAVLEWRGKLLPIDTRYMPGLSQRPIPATRVWQPGGVSNISSRISPQGPPHFEEEELALVGSWSTGKRAENRENGPEISRGLENVSRAGESEKGFSASDVSVEEIAQIAAGIAAGKLKTETLKGLARYSGRRAAAFSSWYDLIKEKFDTNS